MSDQQAPDNVSAPGYEGEWLTGPAPTAVMRHTWSLIDDEESWTFALDSGSTLVEITADHISYAEGYDPDPMTRQLWESFQRGLVAKREAKAYLLADG